MSTLVEARKNTFPNHKHPDFKEMYVVSVGTGKVLKNYDYEKVKKWGLLQWVAPIIDMMMSSSAEVVSYQVKKAFVKLINIYIFYLYIKWVGIVRNSTF